MAGLSSSSGRLRLDRILRVCGALPPPVAIDIATRCCDALEEAYALDLAAFSGAAPVRELEPAAIQLAADGSVNAADIGLPDLFGDLTVADREARPALYGAPESLAGWGNSPRADVFLLGVLLWEMATGLPLFPRRPEVDARDLLERHLDAWLGRRRVVERLEDLSPGLGDVVGRCLEQEAERRYADPGQLARELRLLAMVCDPHPGGTARFLADYTAGRVQRVERGEAADEAAWEHHYGEGVGGAEIEVTGRVGRPVERPAPPGPWALASEQGPGAAAGLVLPNRDDPWADREVSLGHSSGGMPALTDAAVARGVAGLPSAPRV